MKQVLLFLFILQLRNLSTERLSHLPKGTQLKRGFKDPNPGSLAPESHVPDPDILPPPLGVQRIHGQGVLQGLGRNYEHVDSVLTVETGQSSRLTIGNRMNSVCFWVRRWWLKKKKPE